MPFIEDFARYAGTDPEQILDAMFEVANERRNGNLSDDEISVIREFYEPFALVVAQLQLDMGQVLDSTRLRYANGTSLDLIGEQIGIIRESSKKATGTQEFYFPDGITSSIDINIPKGTIIQTAGTDPILFETTDSTTLTAGDTITTAPIAAVNPGSEGNVGPNSITEWGEYEPNPDLEIQNPESTVGGRNNEDDDDFRERIQNYNAEAAESTYEAIIREVEGLENTESATVFINDTPDPFPNGQPPGTIEVVVNYDGDMKDVAEALMSVKAAGEPPVGGYSGARVVKEVELPNGQLVEVPLTSPGGVEIYVDIELTYNPEDYAGDNAVLDNIVDYLGGYYSDGSINKRGLEVGDDVLFGEIEYHIRNVAGVYDVTSLAVDTVDPPENTSSNISIANDEDATCDARSTSSTFSITATEYNP